MPEGGEGNVRSSEGHYQTILIIIIVQLSGEAAAASNGVETDGFVMRKHKLSFAQNV